MLLVCSVLLLLSPWQLTRILLVCLTCFVLASPPLCPGPPPAETTLYDYRVALKSFGQKLASHKDKSKPVMELAVPGTGTRYSSGPCDPTQGCIIAGDVKFCFLDQDTIGSDDPMFHCWINTAFVDPHSLRVTLTKAECDKAVKDKKCEKFDREFKVEFQFVRVE